MFDIIKGFPYRDIRGQYVGRTDEDIEAGHMVAVDENGELVLASGGANEYAVVAMNDQPTFLCEQGGKIAVLKENAEFATDKYKSGVSYTPDCKLQVSVTEGEEGLLTIHAGEGAPVIGRYLGTVSVFGTTLIKVNLCRS